MLHVIHIKRRRNIEGGQCSKKSLQGRLCGCMSACGLGPNQFGLCTYKTRSLKNNQVHVIYVHAHSLIWATIHSAFFLIKSVCKLA